MEDALRTIIDEDIFDTTYDDFITVAEEQFEDYRECGMTTKQYNLMVEKIQSFNGIKDEAIEKVDNFIREMTEMCNQFAQENGDDMIDLQDIKGSFYIHVPGIK